MSSIHDLIVRRTGLTFVNTKRAHQCSSEHLRLQSPWASEASPPPSSPSSFLRGMMSEHPTIRRDQRCETSVPLGQIAIQSTKHKPPRHQHHHRTTSSRSQRAGDDTNCHPHVRQEIDVIHEGAGPEGSCDVKKRWLRRTPMPRKHYRMPPVIQETQPRTERPKKAPRAETGDETKWATSLGVPGA